MRLLAIGLGAFALAGCIRERPPAKTADSASADEVSDPGGDDGATDDTGDRTAWTWNLDNHAGVSDAHAQALVERALDGLGFSAGDRAGPRADDRYFVGRYYIAWIDQTGFQGKINGLWQLDGAEGEALDFVWTADGRPLSLLIVGEDGDGAWAGGYPGGEHMEFPNRTPEDNDLPICAENDWCNQYAHEEAADFDDSIPWWSACNEGTVDWDTLLVPIVEEEIDGGIRLVWEGPLVKEADGDWNFDGDACHEDWLFADGVRRPVYLRAGYRLYGDRNHIDRLYQFRNGEGNPDFDGPMGVIGGYVLTRWPDPHPLKSFDSWFQPHERTFTDGHHDIELTAGAWSDHRGTTTDGDEVFGWIGQPFSFSALPARVAGRTLQLSHIGPSDNDDVGICLCRVHGAIEMGGGLLHGGISMPIAGGETSIEAVRRVDFGGAVSPHQQHTYDAASLQHGTGEARDGGWGADTASHEAGHLVYGPYATDWVGEAGEALFDLSIDVASGDSDRVLTLDVYDGTADAVLATVDVLRTDFPAADTTRRFRLGFDLRGREGHRMETRVYWYDNAAIQMAGVHVETWRSP